MSIFKQQDRVFDVSDPKWARPEIQPFHFALVGNPDDPISIVANPDYSDEERAEAASRIDMGTFLNDIDTDEVEVTEYEAPGCPEEPETPAKVFVYRPKALTKRAKVLFYICGGGLSGCIPNMFPIRKLALRHNCAVVVPIYRENFKVKFPCPINDLHACYAWMAEHADELNLDAENVVITGESSGGQLACSLPFRIMRYGFSPKGVVVQVPIVDDRHLYSCGQRVNGTWDSPTIHNNAYMYVGRNVGSMLVGPEAYANHASVVDCVGYPPLVVLTGELDGDVDNTIAFAGKVREAGSFSEVHVFGGVGHEIAYADRNAKVVKLYEACEELAMNDCWDNDLRRPWVYEDAE